MSTQQVAPLACGQFTKKSKKKQYPLYVEKKHLKNDVSMFSIEKDHFRRQISQTH